MILQGRKTELVDVQVEDEQIVRSLRKIFGISSDLVYDKYKDKLYEIVEEYYGSHCSVEEKEYKFKSQKERDIAKYVLELENYYLYPHEEE